MNILPLPTLDNFEVRDKTALVRTDLNVPMEGGRVTNDVRVVRLLPTLAELSKKGARVVILSHLGRPQGKFVPAMSLAPLVDALSNALEGREILFGVDCIGAAAKDAVAKLKKGQFLLLENLRFHAGEEGGDDLFARELAGLGDVYINDAFSCSHRPHASITGLPKYLPSAAGRLLQQEVENLESLLSSAQKPSVAIIGGSKVSTKLALLENLIPKVDKLIIGGAMANTFLLARGCGVGRSLVEKDLRETAKNILKHASKEGCEVLLPTDVVAVKALQAHAAATVCDIAELPKDHMIVDVGPESMTCYARQLQGCKTALWNGPLGAFETSPFDCGTNAMAQLVAKFTRSGSLKSVAGGGDTVSAIAHAGLADEFTYLSTAGGAFLEWLEGKQLPGLHALCAQAQRAA